MRRLAIFGAVLTLLAAAPALAGLRARYGGTLRVAIPAEGRAADPALARSSAELAVAGLRHSSLLRLGRDGTLRSGLAELPEAEAGGRLFRLRLRPGLRFHDGSAATARDAAAALGRLASPELGSPFAALALPLVGAGEGGGAARAFAFEGENGLQVSLAFPYPDWPKALAHPAAALVAVRGAGQLTGAGPFAPGPAPGQRQEGDGLVAFEDHALGRPFVDGLRLSSSSPRAVARAVGLGEADAAFGAAARDGVEGPALFPTYLALREKRLGDRARPLRTAIEALLDPATVTRFFVRAPAAPMHGLLPPALDPSSSKARPRPGLPTLPAGLRLSLVFDAASEDHGAVAERLQVKLHDLGVTVALRRLPRAELRSALAAGDYDLALVGFSALPEAGMALAQLVDFANGPRAAREELRLVGAGADPAARAALAAERAEFWRSRLPLLPLYVESPRLVLSSTIAPVGFDGAGVPQLADAWFTGVPAR